MRLLQFSLAPIALRACRGLLPLALLLLLAGGGAIGVLTLRYLPAEERLMQAQATYSRARQTQSRQQALRKTEEELKAVWQELPARKDFADLILTISDVAQQDRVAIPGMTYTLQKIEDGLALKAVISFNAAGEYAAIRRFIHRLETTGEYLYIESLNVSRSAGGMKAALAPVTFNIKLATFLRPDPPQQAGGV